jgi:hypothetical protein
VRLVDKPGAAVCRIRKIELDEARDIALSDSHAPFIYVNVNNSDAKEAGSMSAIHRGGER